MRRADLVDGVGVGDARHHDMPLRVNHLDRHKVEVPLHKHEHAVDEQQHARQRALRGALLRLLEAQHARPRQVPPRLSKLPLHDLHEGDGCGLCTAVMQELAAVVVPSHYMHAAHACKLHVAQCASTHLLAAHSCMVYVSACVSVGRVHMRAGAATCPVSGRGDKAPDLHDSATGAEALTAWAYTEVGSVLQRDHVSARLHMRR